MNKNNFLKGVVFTIEEDLDSMILQKNIVLRYEVVVADTDVFLESLLYRKVNEPESAEERLKLIDYVQDELNDYGIFRHIQGVRVVNS